MTQREIDLKLYSLFQKVCNCEIGLIKNEAIKSLEEVYGINGKDLGNLGGQSITPIMVNNFVNEFTKIIKPKTILDPTIGLGFTEREISENLSNNVKIRGIEINETLVNISKKISEKFQIEYVRGNAIDELKTDDNKYDFIFGDLPWSIKIPGIQGDGEYEIMRLSLDHLNEGGYAIFTNPDKFFSTANKEGFINNKNYSLVGNIRIPAGSYMGAALASNLLIFKKGKSEKVFLGNLNEGNSRILVKNFFKGKGNLDSRCLDLNFVESYIWEKQLWHESINKQIRNGEIKLIKGFKINGYNDIDLEINNCVYIKTFGKHEVHTISQLNQISDDIEKYKNGYLQVVLPDGYNTEIFSSFYNSKSNKKLLDIYGMYGYNRIHSNTINDIKLYYPNIDEKKALGVINKIKDLKNIINSLSSELEDDYIGKIESINSRLNKIQLLAEDELLLYNFPTSIRKQYSIYKNQFTAGHYNQAFHFIDHIFMSCSILCISILRGAIVFNEDLLLEYKEKLVTSVERFNVLGFGDIVYLYRAFISVFEDILTNKDKLCLISTIYGTDNLYLIESLINRNVPILIEEFGKIRNKYAHSGATTEEVYKKVIEEKAEPLLKNFISKISVLKDVSIYICGDGEFDDNHDFHAKLTLFRGDLPKNVVEIVSGSPIKNKLYFKISETGNLVPMPGLIQYDKVSAAVFNESSYFYTKNLGKDKKLQYHTYEFIETGEKLIGIKDIKIDPLFDAILNKKYRTGKNTKK